MSRYVFKAKGYYDNKWYIGLIDRKKPNGNLFIQYFPNNDDEDAYVRIDPDTLSLIESNSANDNGFELAENNLIHCDIAKKAVELFANKVNKVIEENTDNLYPNYEDMRWHNVTELIDNILMEIYN